jgi:hypothetical protein
MEENMMMPLNRLTFKGLHEYMLKGFEVLCGQSDFSVQEVGEFNQGVAENNILMCYALPRFYAHHRIESQTCAMHDESNYHLTILGIT